MSVSRNLQHLAYNTRGCRRATEVLRSQRYGSGDVACSLLGDDNCSAVFPGEGTCKVLRTESRPFPGKCLTQQLFSIRALTMHKMHIEFLRLIVAAHRHSGGHAHAVPLHDPIAVESAPAPAESGSRRLSEDQTAQRAAYELRCTRR
jgi:hypothetical protein